jgi:hypothetical protein
MRRTEQMRWGRGVARRGHCAVRHGMAGSVGRRKNRGGARAKVGFGPSG